MLEGDCKVYHKAYTFNVRVTLDSANVSSGVLASYSFATPSVEERDVWLGRMHCVGETYQYVKSYTSFGMRVLD